MANYFNADYYFAAKAKQLSNIPGGKTYTAAEVKTEFAKLGISAEDHYKAYGQSENLNPNAYFNEAEYLATKLASLQENAATKAEWTGKTVAQLKTELAKSGLSAAEHYEQFGAFETRADGTLLNPSNAFDANAFFSAKLAQLQDAGYDGADKMTVQDVVNALKGAGLSPVSHFQSYGAAESKTDGVSMVQTVPVGQRVANDANRAALGELVPGNYNQPSKGPASAVAGEVTKPADMGGLSAAAPNQPSAPVKTPADAGFVAPPASLKDGPNDTVIPPTTDKGTGPNASFVVVGSDGKGTVVNPDGKVQGTIDKVEKDANGNYKQPDANVSIKDPATGEETNKNPIGNDDKPVPPPTDGGDTGDGGGTTTPVFAVTKGDDGEYTMGTGNGPVEVTLNEASDKYVFTPTTGTKVEVLKADLSESLTVNAPGIIKGEHGLLAGIAGLKGTGGATLTDGSAATVASLKTINDALSGTITLNAKTNAENFTGTAADLADAFDGITSLTGTMGITGNVAANLADLVTINKATTGVITLNAETISAAFTGSAADLAAAFDGITTSTGTLTIDGDVAASLAELVTINKATTVLPVLNAATKAADFSGTSADILAAFDGFSAGALTGKLTVTSADTAAHVATILALTTGVASVAIENTYETGTSLTVQVGDVINLNPSKTTTALKVDAESAAGDVNAAGKWFFDASSKLFTWWDDTDSTAKVNSITFTGAEGVNVAADGTITILGGRFDVTASSNTYTVGNKNGDVVVTDDGTHYVFTPTYPNGAETVVTPVKIAKDALASTNTLAINGVKVSGSANVFKALHAITGDVTVNDTGKVAAADLNSIDGKATNVNLAASVTSIEGAAADVATVFNASTITGDGKAALNVTLTDAHTLTNLLAINNATTGTITLHDKTVALTGDTAENMLLALEGITGYTGAVTITDTSGAKAAEILALNELTTGKVDANTATTITGTLAELTELYAVNDAAVIGMPTNPILTVSDTDVTAKGLTELDGKTTGTVTVTAVTDITGTSAELAALYATTTGFTGLGDEAVIFSNDHTLADLKTVNAATTGEITLHNTAVALVGSGTDVIAALDGITDYTGALTLSDATITAGNLKTLDTATSGKVTTSAASGWTITALNGVSDLAATDSVDKFVFASGDVGVEITGFATATDTLQINALTGSSQFGTNATADTPATITSGSSYFVTSATADGADTAAKAAGVIAALGTWTNAATANDKAFFVVADNDSTVIYLYTEDTSKAGVDATELTIVATVDSTTVTGDFIFTA